MAPGCEFSTGRSHASRPACCSSIQNRGRFGSKASRNGKHNKLSIQGQGSCGTLCRYIPVEGEVVVGFVTERHSENFIVDINGPFSALLPQLSFEGATKRNRPNLRAGDVVYARVASASRDMEPVLTCVDAAGESALDGGQTPWSRSVTFSQLFGFNTTRREGGRSMASQGGGGDLSLHGNSPKVASLLSTGTDPRGAGCGVPV